MKNKVTLLLMFFILAGSCQKLDHDPNPDLSDFDCNNSELITVRDYEDCSLESTLRWRGPCGYSNKNPAQRGIERD